VGPSIFGSRTWASAIRLSPCPVRALESRVAGGRVCCRHGRIRCRQIDAVESAGRVGSPRSGRVLLDGIELSVLDDDGHAVAPARRWASYSGVSRPSLPEREPERGAPWTYWRSPNRSAASAHVRCCKPSASRLWRDARHATYPAAKCSESRSAGRWCTVRVWCSPMNPQVNLDARSAAQTLALLRAQIKDNGRCGHPDHPLARRRRYGRPHPAAGLGRTQSATERGVEAVCATLNRALRPLGAFCFFAQLREQPGRLLIHAGCDCIGRGFGCRRFLGKTAPR